MASNGPDSVFEPRRLVLNDLLCYVVNKYTRVNGKLLKSVLLAFYIAEDFTLAKDVLNNEIVKLNANNWPKPKGRRPSVDRSSFEVDDILTAIGRIIDNNMLDQLPLFVCSDPDRMPSLKVTDGDIAMFVSNLAKLEDGLVEIKKSIQQQSSIIDAKIGPAALRSAYQTKPHARRWESNMDTATGTDEEMNDFSKIISKKRRRELSSKERSTDPQMNLSNPPGETAETPSFRSKETASAVIKKAPTRVGTAESLGSLKAARSLTKKQVFCVSNVNIDVDCDEISTFIKSLNVRVLSCYDALSRSDANKDKKFKSFRICIDAEDKSAFLDMDKWPVNITIREWSFASSGTKSINKERISVHTEESTEKSLSIEMRSSTANIHSSTCDALSSSVS